MYKILKTEFNGYVDSISNFLKAVLGLGSEGESLLIQRIKEGEEHALNITYLKYHTLLRRYLWKYIRSEESAEDIVQDVFTEVWENREYLDRAGHLRGFLYESARNKALNHIKHQKIVNQYISELKQQKKASFYGDFYHGENDYRAVSKTIEESICNLPPRGRQIFELNKNEGLTYMEISEYLDISLKTVETHMRRAFKKIRNCLSK